MGAPNRLRRRQPRRALTPLANDEVHINNATEFDATDEHGHQGGQGWKYPTSRPTAAPTTGAPTGAPTQHPTLHGQQFIFRGIVWYDRNADGKRDSNVAVKGMGSDVEYSHGVGGVSVQLMQCDVSTGRAVVAQWGETIENGAALTHGFDSRMIPQVIRADDQNGKFNIRVPRLDSYYFVRVNAPQGFLFTEGICNDEELGWECDYPTSTVGSKDITGRKLAKPLALRRKMKSDLEAQARPEKSIGIKSGRSTSCVYVDRQGNVESFVNFGIMRVGDTQAVGSNIVLVLQFESVFESVLDSSQNPHAKKSGSDRLLTEILRWATVIDEEDDGATMTTRYLLGEKDKDAIGVVAAEVLASVSLDRRLGESGISLHSIDPGDVVISKVGTSGDSATGAAKNELSVGMEIKGHYSPPPELDFDYIVQDSINKDATEIRRSLRDYNSNCRDQTAKVTDRGYQQEDFVAVTSSSGANSDIRSMNGVFSTACSSKHFVPEYFETFLKEVEVTTVSEEFEVKRAVKTVSFVVDEYSPMESWAYGPVAAISGLIMLLAGAFVFRRSLGPRRVDEYTKSNKTTNVGGGETRRFGEAGGDVDDGSIDSVFYSDPEEEETEKERRKRHKRKEKDNEQRKGGFKIGRKSRKKLGSLILSQRSEATIESLLQSDNGLGEETERERRTRRKRGQEKERRSLSKTKSSKARKKNASTRNAFESVSNQLNSTSTRNLRKSRSSWNLSKSTPDLSNGVSSRNLGRSNSMRNISSYDLPRRNMRRSASARNLSRSASASTRNLGRSKSMRNLSSCDVPRRTTRRSVSARNLSRSASSSTRNLSSSAYPQRRRRKTSSRLSKSDTQAIILTTNQKSRRRRSESKLAASQGSEDTRSSSSFVDLEKSQTSFRLSKSDTQALILTTNQKSRRRRRRESKLAASQGSEDTRLSSSFVDLEKSVCRERKRDGAAKRRPSSEKPRRKRRATVEGQTSRRGRRRQPGGDNARAFDDAEIEESEELDELLRARPIV